MKRSVEPVIPHTMQAALLVAPEQFDVRDVPRPSCPDGGLLLRVLACAICGSDSRLFLGRKRIKGNQEIDGRLLPGPIIGHEIAGRIVEVGAGVTQYRSDDLVVTVPGISCGTCDPRSHRASPGLPQLRSLGVSLSWRLCPVPGRTGTPGQRRQRESHPGRYPAVGRLFGRAFGVRPECPGSYGHPKGRRGPHRGGRAHGQSPPATCATSGRLVHRRLRA